MNKTHSKFVLIHPSVVNHQSDVSQIKGVYVFSCCRSVNVDTAILSVYVSDDLTKSSSTSSCCYDLQAETGRKRWVSTRHHVPQNGVTWALHLNRPQEPAHRIKERLNLPAEHQRRRFQNALTCRKC